MVLAIVWSFLGVRERVDMQDGFERLPILAIVVAGVIAAAGFVLSILLVVRLVI